MSDDKLKETTEDARDFAIGNKSLASLFVHTPAGRPLFSPVHDLLCTLIGLIDSIDFR